MLHCDLAIGDLTLSTSSAKLIGEFDHLGNS